MCVCVLEQLCVCVGGGVLEVWWVGAGGQGGVAEVVECSFFRYLSVTRTQWCPFLRVSYVCGCHVCVVTSLIKLFDKWNIGTVGLPSQYAAQVLL